MKSAARALLAALIVVALQMTLAHRIAPAGSAPDLVLVLLAVLVIDRRPLVGIVAGFLLGLFQDLGNASLLGMNALAKSIVGYGIARCGGEYIPDSALFRGLLVLAAALVNDAIVIAIGTPLGLAGALALFLRDSLLAGVYTAVLAVLVMQVVRVIPGRAVRAGGRY